MRAALGLAVVLAVIGLTLEAPCAAQPAPSSADRPSDDLPFYDAQGATLLGTPATPPPRHPFILAPSVNVGELALPGLSSNAIWVEPMVEVGNDLWAFGIGYANLAGAHGFDLDGSIGEWSSAVRLFDSGGWRGSWLLPDLHARFSYYPGSPRLPSWIFGGTTKIGGLRFAKNLGKTSFEMSAAAVFGPMMVKIDSLYGAVLIGGHLDMGVAFWP